MNKLLVNEQRLLEKKTIEMLRLVSVQFEKKVDRSMLILGTYAITPDSVGPVSSTNDKQSYNLVSVPLKKKISF